MEPQRLIWARRLMALAQNGLTYTENEFDRRRYEEIRQIAAEMTAALTGDDVDAVVSLFCREQGYATPKVDVRGAVFRDDAILLVKERSDGKWSLPGGWADVNESPRQCVQREVWEESGFTVRATRLVGVYDRIRHPHEPLFFFHIYKLFFLCEITGGRPTVSDETDAVDFFRETDLPELSLTKITPGQIADMFAWHHGRRCDVHVD